MTWFYPRLIRLRSVTALHLTLVTNYERDEDKITEPSRMTDIYFRVLINDRLIFAIGLH